MILIHAFYHKSELGGINICIKSLWHDTMARDTIIF